MKKYILLFLFIAIAVFSKAQITVIAGKHASKFFKSYEDYKADKPIEGIKLESFQGKKLEYTENGTKQKAKASSLPYQWFCNIDGTLVRSFNGDFYFMIIDGPISFYIKTAEGNVYDQGEAGYVIRQTGEYYPVEYYSLTPNGTIEKLKDKVLEEYLEKYNLMSKYENDPAYKREMKDCVACYQNKKTNKKIKYIKIVNKKMK